MRLRGNSSYITGEYEGYSQLAKSIRSFRAADLKKNQTFLREKTLKNQGFIKDLHDKRDFICLAKILQTHFATFNQRKQEYAQLEKTIIKNDKEINRQVQTVSQLMQKLEMLRDQNERLKSRILQLHEERLEKNSSQEAKKVVVVMVEEEESDRFGNVLFSSIRKLQEKEESYLGQSESDLPIFRKAEQLDSNVDNYPPKAPPIVKKDFTIFGEVIQRKKADSRILSKFSGESSAYKQQSLVEQSIIYSKLQLKEEVQAKRGNSAPKRTTQKVEAPSSKTIKKIQISKDLFKQFGNPEEKSKDLMRLRQLESKYVEGHNPLMNSYVDFSGNEEQQLKEIKQDRAAIQKLVFKNKFKKN